MELWEILVPCNDNDGKEFTVDYHRGWDEHVLQLAGGLTILKTTKGQWESPDGRLFAEPMIPVRIQCSGEIIRHIATFTLTYYDQEAVIAYLVSVEVLFVHRDQED
jgi:hypothetical protein